jgi:hypothetical protein
MGKILECAAIAATPGSGRDCVMATLYKNHFELEALNPQRRFTRLSTAAHTLYEKTDPYFLPDPAERWIWQKPPSPLWRKEECAFPEPVFCRPILIR